jgi:hypothetical protein
MVDAAGREQVALGDGRGRLRLEVAHGSISHGPVSLVARIDRLDWAEPQWLTLRRLIRSIRQGKLVTPLPLPRTKTLRWLLALRCWDARVEGATHRELAEILVGPERARVEWNRVTDFLRSRVRRALRFNRHMMDRGWKELLINGSMERLRPPTISSGSGARHPLVNGGIGLDQALDVP